MEGDREVLYETRYHTSRPCSTNYPPQHQQLSEGLRGSFLSLLSTRGVSQLKERWTGCRHQRKFRKLTSLFVSPTGERVAVAVRNQITILQKDDDYQEPCGYFTSSSVEIFTYGVWSESHDVLGVADDTGELYFIKANGEEITRITKGHLKVSFPIVGLTVQNGSDMNRSCLCRFNVLTSDGSLHAVEISQDTSASIFSARTSNSSSSLKEFPENVFCFDYHPEICLLAAVGGSVTSSGRSGTCSLSLWRQTRNLYLEPVSSTHLEGLYSNSKGYLGRLTSPKVLISPQGKFVATVDLRGCMLVFKLDGECSLSNISHGEKHDSQVESNMSTGVRESLNEIVDFTWWSDNIIALAKRSGNITMIDILTGIKLLKKDPSYSTPILERVHQFPGHLFILENTLAGESHDSSNKKAAEDMQHLDLGADDMYNDFDIAKLRWSLISFSKRSVSEMYGILISSQKYQAALEFAEHHGLDGDEILKSQWLHSVQGITEVNMFLSAIKDQVFVLSECVDRIVSSEEAVRALLALGLHLTNQYRFSEAEADESRQIWDFRLVRLKLLQFRDKLETFLGLNMGRFSVQEYRKFCIMPINEAAVALAENGKIGGLNLLFKRHPYSLTPFMLEILAAIPETVPIQSYGQLLPGDTPPSSVVLRERDWVECQEMVTFMSRLPENNESSIQLRTEHITKQCLGISWPSTGELSIWYKNRARDIDSLSGQLGNCLALIDFACRKGIHELQPFCEDISYLQQLIYSNGIEDEVNFNMNLVAWERLSDYEKFKMMLKGVNEENVVEVLSMKAIPFMKSKCRSTFSVLGDLVMDDQSTAEDKKAASFVVRWLKETASENKLELCLKVIEDGCRDFQSNSIFRDKAEAVECSLQCIYSCTVTDRWSSMASILSKLSEMRDSEPCLDGLKKRIKLAEGHIEAGRLLSFYQVPKPINYFLNAHSDVKGVKQILRLILSKFIRRQPGRSDSDWANMWRDLVSLQEKTFPYLDQEYILMEFCRGLLKAGKFSLAMNYLRGTASVALAADKAENLVIQTAREYFFSASSLSCSEIWKATECLNLLPSSRNVKAEADIIEALTVKLPNLGVTLLPLQFRLIKDPMEIIKLAITSQGGACLNVDELIEIAKLFGLSSQDDISAVQEAIAREAAVAGDLQLAFDLCLVLAKKGHGSIWDLCVAMARGSGLENINISSRKQLLGFALSYCDEESIGELLHAWKDLDLQGQCERLMMLTGTDPPNFSVHGFSIHSFPLQSSQGVVDLSDCSQLVDGINSDNQEIHASNIADILSLVAKDLSKESAFDWETLLRENSKLSSFVTSQLPWLLELSCKEGKGKKFIDSSYPGKQYVSFRTEAVVTILSWLANNGFAPRDDLIASLAKSIMETPVTKEEDIIGSSFLLNLGDAFHGVEIIEDQVRTRETYNEICSIMGVGMLYSLLHNSVVGCGDPSQRRGLLLKKFIERNTSLASEELTKIDEVQSSFWREWKLKLEEQKRVADHSRVLEQIIPGVETMRFLSGDSNYIERVVFTLIESVKLEKKHILKDVLKLASTYGLNHTKVLLRYLSSILVSEAWDIDDMKAEISEFINEIRACAAEVIDAISLSVYPAIDGHDKPWLAFLYGLLSDCYLHLEGTKDILPSLHPDPARITISLGHYYKVLEQECSRVSFIKNLNFKNIAGLGGLNFKFFSSEVYAHIDECCAEALATMVKTLISIYKDPVPEGHIMWQDVYRHHVLSLLKAWETRAKVPTICPEKFHNQIDELEQIYDVSRKYMRVMAYRDVTDIMKQFFTGLIPLTKSFGDLSSDSTWKDCLVFLTNFWLRVIIDMQEFASCESTAEKNNLESFMCCLKVFLRLVIDGEISPSQGWGTVIGYIYRGLTEGFSFCTFDFCRAMVLSGCWFGAIAKVYYEAVSQFQTGSTLVTDSGSYCDSVQNVSHLYSSITETILQNLASGSHELQNLQCLLASLSRMDGDLEDLKSVRLAVWERMAEFSDNLQLPRDVRVYALELMQLITASGRNLKARSSELQSNVLPWDGWDDLSTPAKSKTTAIHGVPTQTDAPNRLANTLVALKSSQLLVAISLDLKVTPEDLLTVDSAVSCFLRLCGKANSEPHIDTLVAILRGWEGLYAIGVDEADSAKAADAANDWSNDDWDEGWESFQEELGEKATKKDDSLSVSVHPLHVCWTEIFKKLATLSRFSDLLRLVDQSTAKSYGILLDQVGARDLSQMVLPIDCFVALKMVLVFPYEAIQLEVLDAVEEKLKQGGISDTVGKDHDLLILVLSSGLISTIINRSSSYGTTFSFLCYMVGNFSRLCQEADLPCLKHRERSESEKNEKDVPSLFRRILFPCFVAELMKADQLVLAGFLVTKFEHTNASLSLINIAEASLTRYLDRQLQLQLVEDEVCSPEPENMRSGEPLGNTILKLRSRLKCLIHSASSFIRTN